MNDNLGIMQGRLLPKFKNRFQAHPLGYWQEEFFIAKEIGLGYIEFILDFNDYNQNPLMSDNGISEILENIQKSGVGVRSVCADIFMEAPLHSKNKDLFDSYFSFSRSALKFHSIYFVLK